MRLITIALMTFSLLCTASCSSDHGDSPAAFEFEVPQTPTGLTVSSPAGFQAHLEWDYPSELMDDISGFNVYIDYGGYYELELIATVMTTSCNVEDLMGNLVYCFRVSAVGLDGLEGWRTDSVCEMVSP